MLERIQNNKTSACILVSAVLMVLLLVMQFTPYWQYGEAGEACSISSYVWMPGDHTELEKWISGQVEGYDLNSFVGMPILILLLSAIGAVVCLLKPDEGWTAVFPTLCGVAGGFGYLTNGALRLGAGWTWHLLICIVLAVLGTVSFVQWAKDLKK